MAQEAARAGRFTRSHPDAWQGTRNAAHRTARDRNRAARVAFTSDPKINAEAEEYEKKQRERIIQALTACRGRVGGGWRCNPIGYQPNYTHIPNEKAWNLREAVFLSGCPAHGHLKALGCSTAFSLIVSLLLEDLYLTTCRLFVE
jgi:hypothetical protein